MAEGHSPVASDLRVGRRRWGCLLAITMILISVCLFVDSTTFALMASAPDSGRDRGCYTFVERLLGLTSPSWIRTAEFVLSPVVLLLSLPVYLLIRAKGQKTS